MADGDKSNAVSVEADRVVRAAAAAALAAIVAETGDLPNADLMMNSIVRATCVIAQAYGLTLEETLSGIKHTWAIVVE
jgi:hypothetical protein